MLVKSVVLGVLASSLFIPVISSANELAVLETPANTNSDIGVIGKVGTLGLGVELVRSFSHRLEGRIGVNTFSQSYSDTSGGVDYKGDLDLQTLSLLADWRPYSSGFHMTVGAAVNNNEISAQGTQTGTATVGNRTFTGNASFDTTIKFDDISPYLGLGYRQKTSMKGLSFTAEAGVLFQSDPEVKLDIVAPTSSGVTQADVDAERQQIQNDVSGLEHWPVFSIGFMYKF